MFFNPDFLFSDTAVAQTVQFLYSIPDGPPLTNIQDLAIDSEGNIYVVDISQLNPKNKFNRVIKLDPDGNELLSFESGVTSGNLPYTGSKTSLAVDANGNIYVLEGTDDLIRVFDSTGISLFDFGTSGNAESELDFAKGIAVDGNANIYVSDAGNQRVQVFDSSGTFQFMFGWGVDAGASMFEICTTGC